MNPVRRSRALPALLLVIGSGAACSGIPTKTFVFDAIDAAEKPLPCVVVVDDQWDAAAESGHLVNVKNADALRVTIPFHTPEVDITVMQVEVDAATGKMVKPPRSRSDPSDYRTEVRTLRVTDPAMQLFVLDRR